MENVLMLGNGINRLSTGDSSWENLLINLIEEFSNGKVIHEKEKPKPFPLLYEEILSHALLNKRGTENNIREFIKQDLALIKPNKGHAMLGKVIHEKKIKNIITTNYDYLIEKFVDGNEGEQPVPDAKETKYSLCRRKLINNKDCSVWHIHGEANDPETIVLGQEHYGDTLSKMGDIITRGRTDSNLPLKKLNQRIDDNIIYSWTDYFFRHHVHIVGLSLDFTEIDLWWLLVYRNRQKSGDINQEKERNLKFKIQNEIYFYYPSNTECENKEKNKLEILESLGVKTIPVELKEGANHEDWVEYYERLFNTKLMK